MNQQCIYLHESELENMQLHKSLARLHKGLRTVKEVT
jgi:hypothetical protein